MENFDFEIDGFVFHSTNSDEFTVERNVLPLYNEYKNIVMDDYSLNIDFKKLIDAVSPYFFSIFDPQGKFTGYIFLNDWRAGGHTCAFHIVINEEHQGKDVKAVASKVADKLFEKFNLHRIDCTIPAYNRKVRAFAEFVLKAKFEGIQKSRTLHNGKPTDYLMYAIVKGD